MISGDKYYAIIINLNNLIHNSLDRHCLRSRGYKLLPVDWPATMATHATVRMTRTLEERM